MEQNQTNAYIKLAIPEGCSLLEHDVETSFLNGIKGILGQCFGQESSRPTAVVLLQQGPASDFHAKWTKELTEIWQTELIARIFRTSLLNEMITRSPVPWFFVGTHSCQGSWFSLAASCHRRIWFSGGVKLGIPEVEGGGTPIGPAVENLAKKNLRQKSDWEKNPLATVEYLATLRLIDGVFESCVWHQEIQSWIQEWLRKKSQNKISAQNSKSRNDGKNNSSSWFFEANNLIERSLALTQDALTVATSLGIDLSTNKTKFKFWDGYWAIANQRRKQEEGSVYSSNFLVAQAYLAAAAMQSERFINWHRLQTAENRVKCIVDSTEPSRGLRVIHVDANQVLPVTDCLAKLFDHHIHVVLWAASSKQLVDGLEQIYGRLEKVFGTVRAGQLCENYLSWYQGPVNNSGGNLNESNHGGMKIWLRFTTQEEIEVKLGKDTWYAYRLEGNHPAAPVGDIELRNNTGDSFDSNVPQIVRAVLSKISRLTHSVSTTEPEIKNAPPLSALIRLLFLEELMRTADSIGTADEALALLKDVGFGMTAHEVSWDRFLGVASRQRWSDSKEYAQLNRLFFGVRSQSKLHGISSTKALKAIRLARTKTAVTKWSSGQFQHHMVHFIYACGLALHRLKEASIYGSKEYFIARSIGAPESFYPLAGCRWLGFEERLVFHITHHWPSLIETSGESVSISPKQTS